MSAVTDILATLPMDDLAARVGATPAETKKAAGKAITSLLGGLHHNSQDTAGATSLAKALNGHSNQPDGKLDLDSIDTKDGTKIVKHALGATPKTAATQLGAKTSVDPALLQKLLPVLAPLVLSYLANGAKKKTSGGSITDLVTGSLGGKSSSKGGGLDDLLGGVLGGILGGGKATPAPKANTSGGILGSVLGHLF
ncbi:MAG: DUF937 domain-containing protein [Micrococcales bacterium]|nr:DUF937 domain-containing protein [Micrococcales bacterium]MCL2667937.1 DUF937 domain-containing protein [Micrococcales bacterium]